MAYTTINKPTDYFNTKLYTGNGGTQTISGVGFQPDFTWVKGRDHAYYHYLQDVVRGSQKILYSNNSEAQATITAGISAWNADGYVTGSQGALNYSGRTFVAWNWKAANSQGSSNTDGSINTTYTSVNTTAGFSISTYTGTGANATVGHGLGAVPQVVIARNLTDAEQWTTYHVGLDATAPQNYHVRLNTSNQRVDEASVWNDTAPTSSVFSVGSSGAPNGNGDTHIAYCFAEKKGYSKFGKYTGNNNEDGPFVYLGFKPAFVMVKIIDTQDDNWAMYDNKRNPFNIGTSQRIRANDTQADTTSNSEVDFLSNGFKVHGADGEINGSNAKYIYMAFAEAPLVGTNGVTAKAR